MVDVHGDSPGNDFVVVTVSICDSDIVADGIVSTKTMV
jgi:hypothetical protein